MNNEFDKNPNVLISSLNERRRRIEVNLEYKCALFYVIFVGFAVKKGTFCWTIHVWSFENTVIDNHSSIHCVIGSKMSYFSYDYVVCRHHPPVLHTHLLAGAKRNETGYDFSLTFPLRFLFSLLFHVSVNVKLFVVSFLYTTCPPFLL